MYFIALIACITFLCPMSSYGESISTSPVKWIVPQGFKEVENSNSFFKLVEEQSPKNIKLLHVFIPQEQNNSLEREDYSVIDSLVTVYMHPEVLTEDEETQELQYSLVKQALCEVYKNNVRLNFPMGRQKSEWEKKVYDALSTKKSVFMYDVKKKRSFGLIYSISLSKNHFLPVFMYMDVILFNNHIYYISATKHGRDNQYYNNFKWADDAVALFLGRAFPKGEYGF